MKKITKAIRKTIEIFRDARLLSRTPFATIKTALIWIWLHPTLWKTKHATLTPIYVIDKKKKLKIYVRNIVDLVSIKNIFLKKEYELKDIGDVETIIDLGGYIGESALYFHATYPDARIIVVEPDPESFEMLKKNTETIDSIECVHAAISDSNEPITFYSSKTGLGSSTLDREDQSNTTEVTVPSITFDELLEKYKIETVDILKFDIEGMEYRLLSSIKAMHQIRTLTGEIHYDMLSNTEADFRDVLKEHQSTFRAHKDKNRYTLYAYEKESDTR
jgi:FkbM family methyltransferase